MASSSTDLTKALDRFYISTDPEITDQTRAILTQYSGIPEDELIPHIRDIRDKAWKVFKYPCVGQYSFLNFSISRFPEYDAVVERLKNGETLLDLGCCFGQDVRRLVFDGASSQNITGSELEAEFIGLGYDLFRDKEKLESRFTSGDFLGPEMAGLKEGTFDMIHAAAFFHLFSWEEQVEAVSRAIKMLKKKPGSMLFGRQTGVEKAGMARHPQTRSGEMWRHDLESWERLLREVEGKLGLEGKLESKVEWADGGNGKGEWKTMAFCVKLV